MMRIPPSFYVVSTCLVLGVIIFLNENPWVTYTVYRMLGPERLNVFFVPWLLASPLIMLRAILVRPTKRSIIFGVLLSLISTFVLSNLLVSRKWELRNDIADGANRVFNLIVFSPIEAFVFTLFWAGVGSMLYLLFKVDDGKPNIISKTQMVRDDVY